MPADNEQSTVSGLEKFTKTFWPYIALVLGIIQYIYTQNMASNQGVFVEIRDEQKAINVNLVNILQKQAIQDLRNERKDKDDERRDLRIDQIEARQNNIEKTQILSDGNRR